MSSSKEQEQEEVVKNVDVVESDNVKTKKTKKAKEVYEKVIVEEDETDDDEIDEDGDDEEDEDDDDEDDEEVSGLTDVGMYNILGNFLVDDEGNSIGTSLSNLVKEVSKLNSTIKKFLPQPPKK